jgi:methoxymalonate biosynthesis protein
MSNAVVPPGKPIKLVVWDLEGAVLAAPVSDAGAAALRPGAQALIAALDERGILQSLVASQAGEPARAVLRRLGILDYLLAPQLGARARPEAVVQIAGAVNLALDATLVIAGGPGTKAEFAAVHPEVRAVTADRIADLADDPLMGHSLAAVEPRPRRVVYAEELARAEAERSFAGSREAFVAELAMTLTVARATRSELHRVRELVARTNQLGATYADDELIALIDSPRHACWLVSLVDRFGDCGQVGLVVVELGAAQWTLQLLQCSCRVLPRGVDAIVLHELQRQARCAEARLVVEVRPTRKNEAMVAAYHRAGFTAAGARGDVQILACDHLEPPPIPRGVHVRFERPPSRS